MRKKAELLLNILTLLIVGILLALQLLTETKPVLLTIFIVIFILQIVALIIRIKEYRK